jgi:hypothetical protein
MRGSFTDICIYSKHFSATALSILSHPSSVKLSLALITAQEEKEKKREKKI